MARDSLVRIMASAKDLKFGSPISAVVRNYHFPTDEAIREYFRVSLSECDEPDGEGMAARIRQHLAGTINRKPRGAEDAASTQEVFGLISEDLIGQIAQAGDDGLPLVKMIIGPTGAGKTAFSKSLFTVCLARFWGANIVPSRVEFSKYRGGFGDFSRVTEYELDRAFFSFVRRCQFRDLLVFFMASGRFPDSEKKRIIGDLNLDPHSEAALVELAAATRGLVIDGEAYPLDQRTRRIFTGWLGKVEQLTDGQDRRDRMLYKLADSLGVRFLVSFDGFDSTRLEHFLFERKENSPIHYLVRTLKGFHSKVVFDAPNSYPLETHYLTYLRDTTFARLRTELFRDVGGEHPCPVQWIVPPSYPLLVRNAAAYVTASEDPEVHLAPVLTEDIERAFDRSVFDKMDLDAGTHLAFVFGSSGRRMKVHIRQLLVSGMARMMEDGAFDFARRSSGIGAKTVWRELVTEHSVNLLPSYRILEDLFLNESRQLIPKLELDPGVVTGMLDRDDFDALLEHIHDLDETSGIFGCLLNYFYECFIEADGERQPGMLLLVRILQFVELNPRCRASHVHRFLRDIGYDIPEQVCHFCLFVIIRSELIKWDARKGRRLIRDVPLYITTTGKIAIHKLLFTITYMSEAVLSSIQMDKLVDAALRDRATDNRRWIADCISNASVVVHIIHRIEQIESKYSARNRVDLKPYLIYGRLIDSLKKEASTIIRAGNRTTLARWQQNVERLGPLREKYPDLVLLGEAQ